MTDAYPTGGQMAQPGDYPAGQAAPGQAPAQVAAEQLAAQAAAAPAPDAGPSLEQMQADQREVLLPMEQRIDAMMAQFQSAQAQQAAEIAALRAQLADAKQAAGPPLVEQYAQGVATLVRAHADANPDVPRDVFAPALEAAGQLTAAATDAVSSRDTSELVTLADRVRAWAAKGIGKHVDLSGLVADLDLLGEAAVRLAA